MAKNKSSAKGYRYETRVKNLLTEFTGVDFRRTPNSGGWNKTGGAVIREESFVGDVISNNSRFKFSVEAKAHYEDFSFTAILVNPNKCLFTSWWEQCVEDAKKHSLLPLLFFKPNKTDDWIAIDNSGILVLGNILDIPNIEINIYNSLPTPTIFRWKNIIENINSSKMFKE